MEVVAKHLIGLDWIRKWSGLFQYDGRRLGFRGGYIRIRPSIRVGSGRRSTFQMEAAAFWFIDECSQVWLLEVHRLCRASPGQAYRENIEELSRHLHQKHDTEGDVGIINIITKAFPAGLSGMR